MSAFLVPNFRRSPLEDFSISKREDLSKDLWTRFDRFFEKTLNDVFFENPPELKAFKYPKVNIYETEKDLVFELTVTGLTKDDIKIKTENNLLVVSYNKIENEEKKTKNYLHKEFSTSSFCRTLPIDEEKHQIEKIEASLKDGLLKISIPFKEKKKEEKRKENYIEIKE